MLGRETNIYEPTFMEILLFQVYWLKLEKTTILRLTQKSTMLIKRVQYIFASSMRTNILIWKYVNKHIM